MFVSCRNQVMCICQVPWFSFEGSDWIALCCSIWIWYRVLICELIGARNDRSVFRLGDVPIVRNFIFFQMFDSILCMIWHPNFYVHSSIIHLILLHRASQIVNNGCFIIHKCRISILMKNVHVVGFLIGELEIKCNNILILKNILTVIPTISWHFSLRNLFWWTLRNHITFLRADCCLRLI